MDLTERRQLGGSDLEVPILGMGTNPLGGLFEPIPEPEARKTVHAAWDLGIRFFDTAPAYGYGNAERAVGGALADLPRDEFILTSKVGRLLLESGPPEREDVMVLYEGSPLYKGVPPVKPYFDFTYDGAMRSLEDSLSRLGMDRLDIVYIHDPDLYYEEALEGAYRALDELRSQGVVGAVGVGMNQWEMLARFARDADFDCFLLAGRYSLLDQSALPELLPLCEEKGISLVVGGVYNSGLLCNPDPRRAAEVSTAPEAIRSWAAAATFNYTPATAEWVERAARLKDVCDRHDVPLMAAAIQFPLAHPAVASVLMGPRSIAETEQNVEMFRHPVPDDLWDELKAEGLLPEEALTPTRA
jgi:D-threo-aldose 1-dehydrogenase